MAQATFKIIGNFKVELGNGVVMIKDLKGNLLKAESVKPFDSEDRYAELCIALEEKIKDRKDKGLPV
jgi:hypothetical protein|tara:strand:- start:153 stop:353 length:201 start_codon:yes stop_codon:yes gene_type:complete